MITYINMAEFRWMRDKSGRMKFGPTCVRGIYNRLIEDDRFPRKKILSEAQWRLRHIHGW